MYIVVTGAAGFIGANLVRALNARGETRHHRRRQPRATPTSSRNLVDCEIADYLDKDEFLARLADGDFDDDIAAVLHQGACSDTMETDGRYMMRNNYRYSVALLDWCQDNDVPFLYASSASVYGGGSVFREERAREAPLNVYGYSKFLFDQYVRRMLPERTAQIAGFRYFNVYGPREQHKGADGVGRVAFLPPVPRRGPRAAVRGLRRLRRRRAAPRFRLRRRRRQASISISSTIPERSGIFNLGTGAAATFNDGRARRRSTRAARPTGKPRADARRARRRRRDHVRPVSAGARRQVPELHRRPISRGCAPPATRRRCTASPKACARYVERLISGAGVLRVTWAACGGESRIRRGSRSAAHAQLTMEDTHATTAAGARARAVPGDRRSPRSTSTRRPRTSSSRCRASAPPRRRRSSTTARRTARSSRSRS